MFVAQVKFKTLTERFTVVGDTQENFRLETDDAHRSRGTTCCFASTVIDKQ